MKLTKIMLSILTLLLFLGCNKKKNDFTEKNKNAHSNKNVASEVKVFILHSYEKEHVCGKPQESGIKSVFDEKNIPVNWEYYYMNTKTTNSTQQKIKEQANISIKKIKEFQPDYLFVLDDNAIKHVAMKLLDQPFKIFFSGMNGQPENYNELSTFLDKVGNPTKNMTGVYEYLYSIDSFNTMHRIFPNKNKIIAIIDKTPTGNAVYKQLELELAEKKIDYDFEVLRISTMKEYKKAIQKINNDTDCFAVYNIALSLQDDNQKQVGVKTTFKYFLNKSKVPGIALNYVFSKLGLFGGAAVDFSAMGKQAASMAIQHYNGTALKELKIENAKKYMLIFNQKRAEQLNIDIPKDLLIAADELYNTILLND